MRGIETLLRYTFAKNDRNIAWFNKANAKVKCRIFGTHEYERFTHTYCYSCFPLCKCVYFSWILLVICRFVEVIVILCFISYAAAACPPPLWWQSAV